MKNVPRHLKKYIKKILSEARRNPEVDAYVRSEVQKSKEVPQPREKVSRDTRVMKKAVRNFY